jgi:saxitoxin biosynthesis operon SxtJ-like protein
MMQVNWDPSPRDLRAFSALWLGFFGFLGYLAGHGGSARAAIVLWVVGASAGLTGLIRPSLVRLLYVTWMGVTYPIGFVVSNLLLAMVFYLVITPVGLLMRLGGRDPMTRRFDRSAGSYWEPRAGAVRLARYFRQY